ncbi:MAG: hypothetical protein ABR588_08650 [Sphingomicrobium sp.]|nr:hypothetical protein [Sphingomonadales bacterium]
MTKSVQAKLVVGAALALLMAGQAGAFVIQAAGQANASTPKSWAYDLKDGKRVPRGNRTTNADGSWREEVRQGQCTTVKEKTANGDYNETRKCD